MNGPPGRGQHQIAGLPGVALPVDDARSASLEEIVDGRRGVAMRAVDDIGRPEAHGGEKRVRRAVGAGRGRIVEKIQAAAGI